MRKARGLAGEPDDLQHVGHGLRDEAAALADLQRERDVLVDGLVAKQPEVLEDDPRLRRKNGTLLFEIAASRWPSTWMSPELGSSSRIMSRIMVLLPEPEAPTRNTNSPFRISKETPPRAGRALREYAFVTLSKENHVERTHRAYGLRSGAPRSVGLTGACDHSAASLAACSCLRHRIPAAMKPSRSPSKTACGLFTSWFVRRSLTIDRRRPEAPRAGDRGTRRWEAGRGHGRDRTHRELQAYIDDIATRAEQVRAKPTRTTC